ncbi:hypothetical protein [Hymenobacter negativus]|uniref:Uncharacterized protein n=1 Tax=Hymenobacter negativus TaxID=2795026 RepID=A0ABS3Q8I3_9BACT|nr:hypothetical protein [Hymenobacter negativus]MBO2007544.1 hypothetical protein [Hymenobacter negativus]
MKKASIFLAMVTLFSGSTCLPANAVGLATTAVSVKAVYPDNDYFFAGLYQGRDFVDAAAATYGKGTPDYYAAVDAEIAMAQDSMNGSPSGSDDQYYWWGYRTGLQQRR